MLPAREPPPPPPAARHNLPAERTGLIGRERERAAVAQSLGAARLVTLTGVGGGGKTRLARAVAADLAGNYPDSVWLVELAPLAEPALLPEAVAATLGLQPTRDADPLADLLAYLRPRALLLVLDNCEHLIDACADLAARALAVAPGLRILATSREPLRVAGERQFRLAPLATPNLAALPSYADLAQVPAVRLFVARAHAADPAFRLTEENAAAVAAICARLDGIPLALELAAARVGVLALGQILERLHDSVRLLTRGNRAGPTRQQTLRATLEWGDALLTPDERALFRRLAVFAGGCDLAAAEVVGAGDDLDALDVLDLLAGLVDKSLVLAETGPQEARYRLLEPVRQFAAAQLSAHGERDAVRARHAAHYLTLAGRSGAGFHGPEQVAWRIRLTSEVDNLRAALSWGAEEAARGDPAPGLRLATALVPFWEARGDLLEGRGRLLAALAATPAGAVDAMLRVRALHGAGRLAYDLTDYAAAAGFHAEALAGARALDDQHLIATALDELGMAERMLRDLDRATRHSEEALARFRALGDRRGTAHALRNLGSAVRVGGDTARAAPLIAESLALYQEVGDLRCIALARSMLALVAAQEGDLTQAAEHFCTALAEFRDIGDRLLLIFNLMGLAEVLFAQGRQAEAARLLGAAQVIGEAAGAEFATVGHVTYAPFLARAQVCLAEAPFAAAWAEGRALSLDLAVDYALALRVANVPIPPAAPARTAAHRLAVEALTPREHEVALLVARGHSDREIADALFISRATASVHVRNILAKLDLRSRHQVADWAVARGLAAPTHD